MEQEQRIELEPCYVLVYREKTGAVEGEVVMRAADGQGTETGLFAAPPQASAVQLEAWARRALAAYREG